MEHERFDVLRLRLEEQLRADVELLYEAHRIKMRAFETVWRAQAELDAALQSPPPPPAGSGKRQEAITLLPSRTPPPTASPEEDGREILPVPDAVIAAFHQLPEVFDKHDVHRVLGFEPSRSTLFRVLKDLIQEGSLRVESTGTGRRTSRFRKLTARHHEAEPEQNATQHSSTEQTVERNEKTGEDGGAQLDHGA